MPRSANSVPLRIAIDTGGTFTDCVWIERGVLKMLKVFSTPADPSLAIAEAVSRVTSQGEVLLLHGTTVGTNGLLQRKGARIAFVTTAGFEDSIQIGRQARPKLYDLCFDAIEPLVPPELRFGVHERTDKAGKKVYAPSDDELWELTKKIASQSPEAIALSLLFCYANPANEEQVAAALSGLALPISISHQILPEFREYERASTVVVNAYLQPVVQKYFENLRKNMSRGRIFVMQSNGGLTSLENAASEPVRTVLSGPAGGVVGAAAMAAQSGFTRIIAFDMGGTSTDVCLVDGLPRTTNEAEVAGFPVHIPMLNIHTVGAGGGSLARFDLAGGLRVGPESAGADPGPICYGRGSQPTVTDCNLLLGRLPADRFLGGDFTLDLERTRRVTAEWLKHSGSRLRLEQFAEGVIRVVNATMEKAIRLVSIEKGYDTRDYTLIAFGGAGALHACELAAELGIPRVIVPRMPGGLSALGILVSDVVKDYSRTLLFTANGKLPKDLLKREVAKLERRAHQEFTFEKWPGRIRMRSSLDLRYKGQGFELNVENDYRALERFHSEHQRRYGYMQRDGEVEIVTIRLRASIPAVNQNLSDFVPYKEKPDSELRNVYYAGRIRRAKVIKREFLAARKWNKGAAIVTEYSATTFVPPGMRVQIDEAGSIVIETKTVL